MNNNPIGIFDSGIGGLTVLKKIIQVLPNEKYIYYADKDNVPYGIKQKDEVKKYIKDAMEFFKEKEVKAVVIACNTATSIAIKELREKYTIPIIGIEPAVKPAVENRGKERVLIMATPTTIREEKLKYLLKRLEAEEYTDLIPMPRLVVFAENGDFESNEVKQYIIEQLKNYKLEDYSELVLGCTHFPFFKDVLNKIFPQKTKIIDGSVGVANRLKDILQKEEIIGNNQLEIEYYYSGRLAQNKEELEQLLYK